MQNKLTDMQKKLLPILEWFHNVCVENGLIYYLEGGTMLGAVRHKGFIPWDDDLDVCMPREDYEKFNRLFGNKTSGFIHVETEKTNNKDFIYGFTKVYDINTTLIEDSRIPIKRGLFLDVFPLDGGSNDFNKAKRILDKIYNKRRILAVLNYHMKGKISFYKKILIKMFRLFLGCIVKSENIIFKINKFAMKRKYDECEYVLSVWGAWKYNDIILKKYFGTPKLYDFEGLKLYGVEFYDEYLTSVYGDWRTLPPVEKRVSHHNFIEIDLNKSYKD